MSKRSMTASKHNGKVTSAQIRLRIEQTRCEMDQTLAQLQEKLDRNPLVRFVAKIVILMKDPKTVAIMVGSLVVLLIACAKITFHSRR